MKCKNSMCIYQGNGKCIKDDISIDEHGLCESIVMPEIPEDTLTFLKIHTEGKQENIHITSEDLDKIVIDSLDHSISPEIIKAFIEFDKR